MPIRPEVRDAGRGIVMVGVGVVTEADLLAANATIYSDTTLSKLRYQLVDLSRTFPAPGIGGPSISVGARSTPSASSTRRSTAGGLTSTPSCTITRAR